VLTAVGKIRSSKHR